MMTFIARRVLYGTATLFAVTTLVFFMVSLTGDPVTARLQSLGVTPAEIAAVRHALGYDQPIPIQYVHFLEHIAHGDFGTSVQYGEPALSLVADHVPYTAVLAAVAFALSLAIGIPLGTVAALNHDGPVDGLIRMLAGFGQSAPTFVVGPLLILIFAVLLGWLPVSGAATPESIVMPALALSVFPTSRVVRLMRASTLETATADFIVFARAKGIPEIALLVKHLLRNSLLPIITISGVQLANMLGGAVVVETIFGWPGVGLFAENALLNADLPIVETVIILVAAAVVVVNLATDVIVAVVDPRVDYG